MTHPWFELVYASFRSRCRRFPHVSDAEIRRTAEAIVAVLDNGVGHHIARAHAALDWFEAHWRTQTLTPEASEG